MEKLVFSRAKDSCELKTIVKSKLETDGSKEKLSHSFYKQKKDPHLRNSTLQSEPATSYQQSYPLHDETPKFSSYELPKLYQSQNQHE